MDLAQTPKPPRGFLYRKYLAHIQAGGGLYITDCQPWEIKAGCKRQDCPMRTLALAPEAGQDDYLLQCDPPGHLADFLIMLRATRFEAAGEEGEHAAG